MERDIWFATNKTGVFGCFEVTIGMHGDERVDYLTYDTNGIWRCYEIKATKSDFYSPSKRTFVGHYNYFVMPERLYEQVKQEIPAHIGVYVGVECVKKAKKHALQVDEQVLKDSLIRSLYREYEKQYKSGIPSLMESLTKRLHRAIKERDEYREKHRKLLMRVTEKYGWELFTSDETPLLDDSEQPC